MIVFTAIIAYYKWYHNIPIFFSLIGDECSDVPVGQGSPGQAGAPPPTQNSIPPHTTLSQAVSSTTAGNILPSSVALSQQSQMVTSPPPNTSVVSAATQQQVALINAAGQQNKDNTPKRLHVSNIPFRFRDPDLRSLFGVRIGSIAFIVCVHWEQLHYMTAKFT